MKYGAIPFKRDESKFPPRKADQIKVEEVNKFPSSNIRSMKIVLNHLRLGEAVVIFPEGDSFEYSTYDWGGREHLDPQPGFFQVASIMYAKYRIRVPIIPIGINYSGGIFKNVMGGLWRFGKLRVGRPVFLDEGHVTASSIFASILKLSENEGQNPSGIAMNQPA
jgi:1-acyl-sn-glycerol-3-phosphate acyltransferase